MPFFPQLAVLAAAATVATALQGAPASGLSCAREAVTCVEIGENGAATPRQPATFGQPFKAGDVPGGANLGVTDSKGHALPLQIDARATYPDGSLRFAVLSTILPDMEKDEKRIVNIVRNGAPPAPAAATAADPFALEVDFNIYRSQISVVKLGNRMGRDPGMPFAAGESIALHLAGRASENFTFVVKPEMAGGGVETLTQIAQAFVAQINKESKHFRAYFNAAQDGYEDIWLTTLAKAEPFTVTPQYSGAAKITILPYETAAPPELWTATYTNQTGKPWLDGAVANEQDIPLPVLSQAGKKHPQLSVRLHLRRYASAKAERADVVVENDWSFAPDPGNITYDVAIKRNAALVFSRPAITQFHHTRWHAIVWSPGAAEASVRFDVPYFLSSSAVPHYDPSRAVSEDALRRDADTLRHADTNPMGPASVTIYMPTTGMRPDIGPLPGWTARYLLSMDSRPRALMFANADAGGSIPVHYRDEKTDLPVSLDAHPGATMMFGDARPADAFPAVKVSDNPWVADTAHLPSLSFVPYLATGDLFYLEETMFWANWVLATVDPAYRGGDKAYLFPNQVRATAWSLRTLGEAATFLPDNHPMKAYFNAKLQNNLAWYIDHFPRNPNHAAVSPFGILENIDQNGQIGPWQFDFFFLSVGTLAEQQVPHAEELMRWMARFSVGRWNAEDQGYCRVMAPAYYIKFRDPQNRLFTSWKDMFQANWPNVANCPDMWVDGSYPGSAEGYIATSYAALGIAEDFDIAGAREARRYIEAKVPEMFTAFGVNPVFDIVPKSGK